VSKGVTLSSWFLWPPYHLLLIASDEFVCGQCRVRLVGTSLEIEVSGTENPEEVARSIAERYVKLLGEHLGVGLQVITPKEFGAMPAQMIVQTGASREERERVGRGIQKIRQEFVEDDTLRRCYDYLQAARKKEGDDSLHDLYKVIEAIEHRFGGEAPTIAALGVGPAMKFVKRVANERVRDARHAPRADEVVTPNTGAEVGKALEFTIEVLRACETAWQTTRLKDVPRTK
jgi:hypothetical protein